MARRRLICLTPVKNEAWILEMFLATTSLWADEIIVADQQSTDETADIARRFPKVRLIENDGVAYSEAERQKLLIDAAREVPGPKVLVALDADEILSANVLDSPEWQEAINAPSGTVLKIERVHLRPGCDKYWEEPMTPVGYVDDGAPHVGRELHSPRVPLPENADAISLKDVKILHYHAVNWDRMMSKMRWYQCHEFRNGMLTSPIDLFRRYHTPLVKDADLRPVPVEWLEGYETANIDVRSTPGEHKHYHWDIEVASWLCEDPKQYAKLAVWEPEWWTGLKTTRAIRDPRSVLERFAHRWLAKSQPDHPSAVARFGERILRCFGW